MVLKIYRSEFVEHTKSLLRRKFIDLINFYLSKKQERFKTNEVSSYLRKLENELRKPK